MLLIFRRPDCLTALRPSESVQGATARHVRTKRTAMPDAQSVNLNSVSAVETHCTAAGTASSTFEIQHLPKSVASRANRICGVYSVHFKFEDGCKGEFVLAIFYDLCLVLFFL